MPSTLALPAGQTSVDLSITINGDDDAEDDESFDVELSATDAAPYTLGQPAKTTITITDDDRPELTTAQALSAQGAAAAPQKEAESPSNAPHTQSDTQGATSQTEQSVDAGSDSAQQSKLSLAQSAWSAGEADGALDVTVNISPALAEASAVNITTRYNGAASAADVSVPATLTLPKDATSATLQISITADTDIEGAESFEIELVAVADAPYELGAPRKTTITINDDDRATLAFSQAAYTVNEGDGELRAIVNMSSALPNGVFPELNRVFGEGHTATSADIGATTVMSKTLTADGSSIVVKIPITNDTDVEGDESFELELSANPGAPYELGAPATATITIVDDDHRPTLTLQQAAYRVNEADGALDITVSISPALPVTSTVNITTQHITSAAADITVPATLTLPKGATSATLRIPVTADTEVEDAELLMIALSAVADAPYELGAPFGAFITILDDPRPALTFEQASYTANEADGAVRVVVNIAPSMPGGSTLLLTPVFGQGHTAASADINSTAPKLVTLAPHVSSVVVLIPITNDTEREVNETFAIALSGGPGTVFRLGSPATATVTIVDNDRPILSFPQSAYFVDEGDKLDLFLNASAPEGTPQTIPAVTILWTPIGYANSSTYTRDFTLTQGGTRAISPMVYRMPNYDNHVTYNVSLVASEGALYDIGEQGTATVTVYDRDRPSQLTFTNSEYSVDETDADGTLNISVNIFPPLRSDSTVNITASYDTASAADVSAPATLTLPQDATSVTIPVTIRGDNVSEGAESFDIALSAVADAPYELGTPAAATITINDDDRATVTLGNVAATTDETAGQRLYLGEAGYTVYETAGALTIPVYINPALSVTSAVNITTRYDTASPADVSVPATLTLPAGATSTTLRIPITADDLDESAETLTITLSAIADAPYDLNQPATATITIKDDNRPTLAFSQAAWSVNEADGEVVVTVNISPTLPIGSEFWFTADFGNGHTATLSDINDAMPVVVTMASKLRSVSIPIRITNDTEVEGNETFAFTLEGGADKAYRLGSPATAIVTIVDDDRATLAFSQAAYSVNEGAGALNIPVKINPALANASAVTITTRYDSATAADVSVPATLTLPAGQTSVDLQIPITADNLVEEAEKLEIELSAVADAPYDLGAPAAAAITITDDDRADLSITSQRQLTVTETDQDFTQNITVNITRKWR